jgi:hypothetical protein
MTIGANWGLIEVDIPVVSVPFDDPTQHNFRERPSASVGSQTLIIALTPTELIFGDLAAFSAQRSDVRNKFLVPHRDGSPQIATLLTQYQSWEADRKNRLGIRSDGIAILLPDPAIPMPIIAATVDMIKSSGKFEHVAIGGGLL